MKTRREDVGRRMKGEGEQHKWEGESRFSGAARELEGWGEAHKALKNWYFAECREQECSRQHGETVAALLSVGSEGPLLGLLLPRTS